MSSTNRWWIREVSDYYKTPKKCIIDFLIYFRMAEELKDADTWKILDPCAWWDEKNGMSYPEAMKQFGINNPVITLDIRDDSPALFHCDYREFMTPTVEEDKYDMIITNPPFALAQEFIEKSLSLVKEWGYVVMLLRLNFFGSRKRYEFRKKNMPKHTFVHHERIWFTDDWKTDSIEYMHCVRQKWYHPKSTNLFII